MILRSRVAYLCMLAVCLTIAGRPELAQADSSAYVAMANAPGAIYPFSLKTHSFGALTPVPAGGDDIAINPLNGEIWETVFLADGFNNTNSVDVLAPGSGATIATIPLDSSQVPMGVVIDAAAGYAFVSVGHTQLLQISLSTYKLLTTVTLGEPLPGPIAISADGTEVFAGLPSGSVSVLSAATLQSIGTLTVKDSAESLYIFDRTLLVIAYDTLYYFDTKSLKRIHTATVPENSVVFSANATNIFLASSSEPGNTLSIEVLDFSSGATLRSQAYPSNYFLTSDVSLSPDRSEIVVASNPILLLDPETLAITATITSGGSQSAAWRGLNTLLLLGYTGDEYGGAVAVIDQSTASVTATFPLSGAPLTVVGNSRLGVLYTGTLGGTINVASARTNLVSAYLPNSGDVAPAAIADRQIFGNVYTNPSYVNVQNGTAGTLTLPGQPNCYYSVGTALPGGSPPDGKTFWFPYYYAIGCGGDFTDALPTNGIAIYDTSTDALTGQVIPPSGSWQIAFSPDSSTAYITVGSGIALYDVDTLTNTGTLPFAYPINALVPSPDGSSLYALADCTCGSSGFEIAVLDSKTGVQKDAFPVPVPASGLQGIAQLSLDGTTLFLAGGASNAVYLVDTGSGNVVTVSVPYPPVGIAVIGSK